MEIFEDGGVSVQTFEGDYTVWCFSYSRLIEVAQFLTLYDANIYVDAISEETSRIKLNEVYTIVEV